MEGTDRRTQISISTSSRQLACVYFRKLAVIDQRDLGAVSMAPEVVSLSLSFILILLDSLLSPSLLLSLLVNLAANDLRRTLTRSLRPCSLLATVSHHLVTLPLYHAACLWGFIHWACVVCRKRSQRWLNWLHGMDFLHSYRKWHESLSPCTRFINGSDRLHKGFSSSKGLSVQGTPVVWHEQAETEWGVLMLGGLSPASLVPEVCREPAPPFPFIILAQAYTDDTDYLRHSPAQCLPEQFDIQAFPLTDTVPTPLPLPSHICKHD